MSLKTTSLHPRLLFPSPGPSTQNWNVISSNTPACPDPSDHSPSPSERHPPYTLSPPGILEIGLELLFTPLWKNPLWFVAALDTFKTGISNAIIVSDQVYTRIDLLYWWHRSVIQKTVTKGKWKETKPEKQNQKMEGN